MPQAHRRRPNDLLHTSLGFDLGLVLDALRPGEPKEYRVPVRRPDDLLVFDLVFENLRLAEGSPPRLERRDQKRTARMIVELPPQSFGEQAFLQVSKSEDEIGDIGKEVAKYIFDSDGKASKYPKKNIPLSDDDDSDNVAEPVPDLPSASIRISGGSRLVYAMPPDETSIRYSLEAVLNAMKSWPLRLDVGAQPDLVPGSLQAGKLGSGLLQRIESTTWTDTRKDLIESLEELGAHEIELAIETSAQRVAERAAAGIVAGGHECLAPMLQEVFHQQVDTLTRRFDQLREGPARAAGIAALALATTERLTASATRVSVNIEAIGSLPFVPMLLAPHELPRTVTALELPYRLLISPIESARFVHKHNHKRIEHVGRAELWHTRMTTGADDHGADVPGKARALWSPDYPREDMLSVLGPPPLPFRMPLDPLDRQMLVKLMAGYDERLADLPFDIIRPAELPYHPRASRIDRLHLSALGALLDAEGTWALRPKGVDLEQWRHLATLGRDHYVRVVYAGFLCPFGHAASLIKVTERKFEELKDQPRKRVAVLRQRYFIVVRERVRTYAGENHESAGHNFPFTGIEILTRTTPDLAEPGVYESRVLEIPGEPIYDNVTIDGKEVPIANRMVFWPMVSSSSDFTFEISATDLSGQRSTFSMPLLFVGEVANQYRAAPIRNAYNAYAATVKGRRWAALGGASVTYAPFEPEDKGDPRLPTREMTFKAGALTHHFPLRPNFYPEIESAWVGIPPLQKLLGQHDAVVQVAYPQVYLDHGYNETATGGNKGKLFLQLKDQVHPLEFGGDAGKAKSDSLGALVTPQMTIMGLSKLMGPVAGKAPANYADPAQIAAALEKIIGNEFDPRDFFDGATILGGIDLADILNVAESLAGDDVPKMLSRELTNPGRIETSFALDTAITKSDPLNLLIPNADQESGTRLYMNGIVTTPLKNPDDSDFSANAELNNFKINLFGFVIIWFETLKFHSEKGQKPDVTVGLRDGSEAVRFGGPLEFVNALQELIPSNGFSDPPSIEVSPSGISAGYSLTLPAVEVGVFTLSNLSLGAGFNLPFDANPAAVKFNFSKRESPFSLTVSLLGGGGFFAIAISSRGVNEIEAALEYGAVAAINLGVASGSVEIKAGIYFHWLEPEPNKGSVELSGYVRIQGELSVLGLISVSITFNLQLAFLKKLAGPNEKAETIIWGEATVVIEVEVMFFSASVEVSCRREFSGTPADPKFIDLIPEEKIWTEYCQAFAKEEVAL